MTVDLFDHPTEREVLTILGAASELNVGKARLLLEQLSLTREDFHLPAHGELFDLATAFLRDSRPVNVVGVWAATKDSKVITPKLVGDLFTAIPGPDHALPGYASTLRALSVKRKALTLLREAQAELVKPGADVEAVVSATSGKWAALSLGQREDKTGEELAHELSEEVHGLADGSRTRCILTGIDVWDQVFGGFECGHITVVCSQPSVGKGKFFATVVDNLSHVGVRPGILSLEDGGTWLPRRQAARGASIPNFVLAKKRLGETQLRRFDEALSTLASQGGLNYRVNDKRMLTPAQILAQARDWVVNHGVKVILLDHLGKVDWNAGKFHRHDLAIADGLGHFSKFAHDYNVPFVIAAHTKRPEGLGKGEDPRCVRPGLSDLALAASIERDARNIAGFYLSKAHPDCILVANLKQTNGTADDDFPINEIKGAAMLASENGALSSDKYESEEQQMLDLGGPKS